MPAEIPRETGLYRVKESGRKISGRIDNVANILRLSGASKRIVGNRRVGLKGRAAEGAKLAVGKRLTAFGTIRRHLVVLPLRWNPDGIKAVRRRNSRKEPFRFGGA